jgi:outer membrane protein OmpA-like peptidoglycan-associated protein
MPTTPTTHRPLIIAFVSLIPLTLAVGCAHAPTDDLVNARRTYQQVASGPTNEIAPAQVYEAKKALVRAERAHEKKPGSNYERDMAYIATRRAEYAMAHANLKQAEAKAEDARARRLALLEEQRDRSRTDLERAEVELGDERRALEDAQRQRQQLEQRLTAATESLEGMARIQQEPNRMVLTLSGAVLFKHNSAELLPIARERLREVAAVLREHEQDNQIVIAGHTDSRGSEEHNRQLSARRAQAVRTFLISEGVSESAVRAVGRGESEPIASNDSAEGRANNRRVEIAISSVGTATEDGEPLQGKAQAQQQGDPQPEAGAKPKPQQEGKRSPKDESKAKPKSPGPAGQGEHQGHRQ